MIPYNFEYKIANTLSDAFSMMKSANGNAKYIAGGHSIVPAMKLRLSKPGTLIDISKIKDLKNIKLNGNVIEIGGLVTHAEVARSEVVKTNCPGLADCASSIGDTQVRNMGTIGGNIAHADPGSDYPGALVGLNATIVLTGSKGSREVAAKNFFKGLFETTKDNEEIITSVNVPVSKSSAYVKFANPASRYAVVGVGVSLEVSSGVCKTCSVGITGAADHAYLANDTMNSLAGKKLDQSNIESAASSAANKVDLLSDLTASSNYRKNLCRVITKRAVSLAASRS